MADSAMRLNTVAVVPLNGANYGTWKIQCRMTLMKDNLWGIVSGTEVAPAETEADKYAKFVVRRDKREEKSTGDYCAFRRSLAVVLVRRPRRPCSCLEKALGAIPKENLGKQVVIEKATEQFETSRRRLSEKSREINNQNLQ